MSGVVQTVVTVNETSTSSFKVILQVKLIFEPAMVVFEGGVISTETGAGTDSYNNKESRIILFPFISVDFLTLTCNSHINISCFIYTFNKGDGANHNITGVASSIRQTKRREGESVGVISNLCLSGAIISNPLVG